MSDSKRDAWRRARRQSAIDAMAYRERQPSKDELRAQLASILANTAALPTSSPPVPLYPFGKTRSEHGGGSA